MTPTSQGAVQALPWPAWLDVLSAVFPPRGTVVVGAGAGNGPWVQWLRSRRASPVWLVEGDEAQYQHLLRHLPEGCDWTPRRDVVAPAPAPTLFYRASNPAENGLIPPERLRTLWPHLAEEGVVEVEAPVTLEALLAEAGDEANWLVLDCLPAAQLLQGGAARLGQLDVALVRVAAGENAGLDRAARHDAVDELLATAGLVCVHTRTERHPALAHALYVREPAGLQAQLAEARSQAAIDQQKLDELTHSLHAARQALEEAKDALARAIVAHKEEGQSLAARICELEEALRAKQATARTAEVQGLFSVSARVAHVPVQLRMNTLHPEWIKAGEEVVEFASEKNAPLYLLSNEDGDFNRPPKVSQLPVDPEVDYVLSGRVGHAGESKPQIYLFQYDADRKLEALSTPVDGSGRFRLGFRTLPQAQSVVVGLRVAGTGTIKLADTTLRLVEDARAAGAEKVERRLEDIERQHRHELDNAVRQIESFVRLQHYMGHETLVPEVHNWPVSPDFGVLLIELTEANAYDAVIEFGSGTSTLILAKALERVARRQQRSPSPLLSFDHLEEYQRKSQRGLEQAGLTSHAQVELAPLEPWKSAAGADFDYYACDRALRALKDRIGEGSPRILVVVDGPPASTGPRARYPALPKVMQALGPACRFHFLMDDYLRPDEQEIVKAWETELSEAGVTFRRTEFNRLEKKACLLEVGPAGVLHDDRGSE